MSITYWRCKGQHWVRLQSCLQQGMESRTLAFIELTKKTYIYIFFCIFSPLVTRCKTHFDLVVVFNWALQNWLTHKTWGGFESIKTLLFAFLENLEGKYKCGDFKLIDWFNEVCQYSTCKCNVFIWIWCFSLRNSSLSLL